MHLDTSTNLQSFTCTCAHLHTFTYVQIHLHAFKHIYIHTFTCTFVRLRTFARTYIHVHRHKYISERQKNWPTTCGAHDERTWNLSRFQGLRRRAPNTQKKQHVIDIWWASVLTTSDMDTIWTSDWGACPSLALHGAREPVKRPLTRFASAWRLGWEGASEWFQIRSAWAAWAAWHSALILLLFVPEMKRKREGVYYNGNYHKANCHVYGFLSISESRELESASAISCCGNRVVHEESKWTLCSVCNKKDKVALRPRNPLLYSLERQ